MNNNPTVVQIMDEHLAGNISSTTARALLVRFGGARPSLPSVNLERAEQLTDRQLKKDIEEVAAEQKSQRQKWDAIRKLMDSPN